MPDPIFAVRNLSTQEVLYNDRVTTYRWEVLEHSSTTGLDKLIGVLDGVSEGSLKWTNNAAVKGSGSATVIDLAEAAAGLTRIGALTLSSVRLRPVCVVAGLPENPLGTFLVSAAKENWDNTGRTWSLELLDRCTVPSEDLIEQNYAVPAGALIMQTVKAILASSGESVAIDESSTLATSTGMVWEVGTSKLKIINELLDVANYNALWMDGYGNFQLTARVLPANRSLTYEVLGITRELIDGALAIYKSAWDLERDSFAVPNKVIAVQAAGGEDGAALTSTWTNMDPLSPYSYPVRNRWITRTLDSVECPAGTTAEVVAFLQKRAQTSLIALSAVQATVKLEHLPIPVRVSDVLRFANTRAGIDSKYVITNLTLDTVPTGLMKSTLQEVISL